MPYYHIARYYAERAIKAEKSRNSELADIFMDRSCEYLYASNNKRRV